MGAKRAKNKAKEGTIGGGAMLINDGAFLNKFGVGLSLNICGKIDLFLMFSY